MYHLCAAITAVRVWTVITGTAVSVPVDSQGRTVASVSDDALSNEYDIYSIVILTMLLSKHVRLTLQTSMSVSRLPVRSVPRVSMKLTATAACVPPAGPGPGVRKVYGPDYNSHYSCLLFN